MSRLRVTRLRNRLLGPGEGDEIRRGRSSARQRATAWFGLACTFGVGLPTLTGYGVLLGKFLPWMYEHSARGAIATASAHLTVSMLASLFLSLGLSNKDLNRLDGDMDWLLTLPASISTLYAMKVAERTLLNVYSWIQIYPLVLAMVTRGEFSWWGAALALLLSLPLLLLVAFAYVLVESGARVWLPRVAINSLQFVATAGGLGLLLLIPTHPQWVEPLASVPWPVVTPAVGLALSASGAVLWHLTRYALETAALLGAGCLLLLRISSHGAVTGAGSVRGRRGAGSAIVFRRGFLARGMVLKELLQLARDRKTLHMALLFPGVLIFPLFGIARSSRGASLFASPTHLPALAFCAGGMAVLSVSNLLHADGKALWLLFTLPRSLARMLAARAAVWVPICLGYAGLVLACGLRQQPLSRELVWGSAYCLVGLGLLVFISAALGQSTVDPVAIEGERASNRGGAQVLLLCVLLAAFASGFYGDAWLRLSLIVLLAAATYGVWQDASSRLPFLLEPELRPAARIGVSDGLACVLLILLLQVFGARLVEEQLQLRPWPARALAFVAAIALVGAVAGLLYWRRGVRDLDTRLGLTWGVNLRTALLQGLGWALPAVGIAVAASFAVAHWPALEGVSRASAQTQPALAQTSDWLIFFLLSAVAAPCVEELLFRGMIYRGLREALSPRASALFTAAVFAAIHPVSAGLPVFLLSLLTTAAFERSRSLASPLLVHLAYNGALFAASALIAA
jgi:membrane protease YdiL (CAAX protease family)